MIDFTMFQIDNVAEQNQKEKFINYFYIMNFWMKALEEGKMYPHFLKEMVIVIQLYMDWEN